HRIELFRFLRLLDKPGDAPVFPARHDSEVRRLIAFDRLGRERDFCTRANVLMQERSKIHPVELVAAENQIKLKRMLAEAAHTLPHTIGGSLLPLRPLSRLWSGRNIYTATG